MHAGCPRNTTGRALRDQHVGTEIVQQIGFLNDRVTWLENSMRLGGV
jgi:hypothetical protein